MDINSTVQLAIGSFVLSIIHALIPNHWIPIVAIGKAEKWSIRETISVGALAAFAHSLSTILLGIVIGIIGLKLANAYETLASVMAPIILILMGLIYFAMDFGHSTHEHLPSEKKLRKRSRLYIIAYLCIAMFFSPCLEIETYYFTAGTLGIYGIAIVSVVYLVVTVLSILLLIYLGSKSIEKYNWHFLEHHEKKITGAILLLLGITAFFLKI